MQSQAFSICYLMVSRCIKNSFGMKEDESRIIFTGSGMMQLLFTPYVSTGVIIFIVNAGDSSFIYHREAWLCNFVLPEGKAAHIQKYCLCFTQKKKCTVEKI